MKVNKVYAFSLSATVSMGFVILGIGFSYFNALTNTLHGQYQLYNKYVIANSDMFNSVMSGIIPL